MPDDKLEKMRDLVDALLRFGEMDPTTLPNIAGKCKEYEGRDAAGEDVDIVQASRGKNAQDDVVGNVAVAFSESCRGSRFLRRTRVVLGPPSFAHEGPWLLTRPHALSITAGATDASPAAWGGVMWMGKVTFTVGAEFAQGWVQNHVISRKKWRGQAEGSKGVDLCR